MFYVWDIETYPNIFTFCGKFDGINEIQLFELSDRMNELQPLLTWLSYLRNLQPEMVGFNNLGFDYPIIHELMTNPYSFSYQKGAQMAHDIITAQSRNVRIKGIGYTNRMIPQIDLSKLNHFDNDAKRTSLKALQFAMRSPSVEDLPFKIRDLNHQEKDLLRQYNVHDVIETERFLGKCKHLIEMRREYIADGILTGDVLNYSDVKIGSEYLITRIGKTKCYAGGKPRQTFRTSIEFKKIILPKIHFRTEQYQAVHEWFKQQTIYLEKEERPKLEIKLAGLDFVFGVGGVHASAENRVYETTDTHEIIDIDVAGMYVAVAIANKFAPEHLGEAYVTSYNQIKEDRARYPKGSSRNAMLKLAGNGSYGNSNNSFSPLYDPQYTFSVTVNGQLQLIQLVELLSLIDGVELIQANTDGITARVRKDVVPFFNLWRSEWEKMTGLVLEEVKYKRMWIRDVNNYIAEKMNGEMKRKGAYWYPETEKDYEGQWNKDFSNFASIKIAEKAMTHSWPLEAGARLITDPFDFMLRYKATGGSKVFIGNKEQLKTVRYYVSTAGEPMKKITPSKGEIGQFKRANGVSDDTYKKIMAEIGPNVHDIRIHTKKKSLYEDSETAIEKGYKVKQCNLATDFDWKDVDWNYYIEEAKKLIIGSK